jgi:GrpB-like predicted nucleotidyltransferase (UPF0157 family)
MNPVVVVEYDPEWPRLFEELHARLWPAISDVATAIEHVGSTSVPGLTAKPIIDLTAVVPTAGDVPAAIERLTAQGYDHQGNLGVEGREAFRSPASTPRHHLYLCPQDSLALRNHLAVRDHLRTHPDAARRYGDLKTSLAERFREDVESYTHGKTEAIVQILEAAGLGSDELNAIRRVNEPRSSVVVQAATTRSE